MRQYIGTKFVMAEPESRLEPLAIEPEEGYRIFYPDGYVSWCPKRVFEEAYRPTDGMTFGLAIEAMKKGLKWPGSAGTARASIWSCRCLTSTAR